MPVALVVLALVAVDSVLPFRQAYAGSVAEAGEATQAARDYAGKVNAAIPEDCGVLQLPYMAYPEHGIERGVNDYDHFWTSITNDGKDWSYGSVKNTDASTWAAQLPQVPSDEQVALLRGAGFCAIHLDTRGYISEVLAPVQADLTARFGEPVATGFDDAWQLYDIRFADPADPADVEAFLRQPFISIDYDHVTVRDSALQTAWWWTRTPSADFVLTPTTDEAPLTSISGGLTAPPCGPVPVTLTLTASGQTHDPDHRGDPGRGHPVLVRARRAERRAGRPHGRRAGRRLPARRPRRAAVHAGAGPHAALGCVSARRPLPLVAQPRPHRQARHVRVGGLGERSRPSPAASRG